MTYWPDADATELVEDDARAPQQFTDGDLQRILKIPTGLV
jgi:hypothetical protein